MTHDTNMLRAKLRQALDRIGKHDGHACPDTKNNHDPALHELFIAGECLAYFKDRHEQAKTAALQMATGLDDAVQSVIDTNAGTSVTLVTGDLYTMTCDINKPAMRLDTRALRNYMQTTLGLDVAVIDKAFDECSKMAAPAKKIKVSSR